MWALLSLSAALAVNDAPLPPAPIIIASTNPATFTLKYLWFDPVVGATSYRIYVTPMAWIHANGDPKLSPAINAVVGINSATNFDTANRYAAIPGMVYGQAYWIQVQTYTATTNSELSSPFEWPQPLTNTAVLTFQQSSNLNDWQAFGPAVVVTNPLGFYRIAGTQTNNIDGFQIRE
jgi:hypothetical protein